MYEESEEKLEETNALHLIDNFYGTSDECDMVEGDMHDDQNVEEDVDDAVNDDTDVDPNVEEDVDNVVNDSVDVDPNLETDLEILYGDLNIEFSKPFKENETDVNELDKEVEVLFKETENVTPSTLRDIGPSHPITDDKEMRRIKGNFVAENKSQLYPLKEKVSISKDHILDKEESVFNAKNFT